jgi:cytochrome P450
MSTQPRHVKGHAEVCSVLADPRYVVPPVEPAGAPGTLSWLRATVARFCNGPDHDRRRALVEDQLAGIDPSWLRLTVHERTVTELRAAAPGPVDLMARMARAIPVATLASAVGAREDEADAVAGSVVVIAAAYHASANMEQRLLADGCVERLLPALGPGGPEEVANRIGLLVQACDATAGLIGNAVNVALRLPPSCLERWPVPAIVAETLRHDPPVLNTRRQDDGIPVLVDLAAANCDPGVFDEPYRFDPGRRDLAHLTFGYGLRPCPGDRHATALACGMVEAVLATCSLAEPQIAYHMFPNLRIPLHLWLTIR